MKQIHPLYIALDFSDGNRAIHFLEDNKLQGVPVKVGMELFYKEGPPIVRELRKRGHPVFLDVKIHDIPNTAEGAVRSLSSLDVDVLTVHAQGGKEMMKRAKQAAGDTRVLAVTHLTSMTEDVLKTQLGIHATMEEIIPHLAAQAVESGLDGVVCSVQEVSLIKDKTGKAFLTLTPGIRLEGEPSHDQKRTATPKRAKENGAEAVVVGRAITQAKDPAAVYDYIMKELESNESGHATE